MPILEQTTTTDRTRQAITVGGVTALAAGLIGVLVEYGVPISAAQKKAWMVIVAAAAPFVVGVILDRLDRQRGIYSEGRHAMTEPAPPQEIPEDQIEDGEPLPDAPVPDDVENPPNELPEAEVEGEPEPAPIEDDGTGR